MPYQTQFGSISSYRKGTIELIDDKAKHYVFSNIFEVASRAKPFEKVVVAKNIQFVIEALRSEGESPWFAASHDEFVICMDGATSVELIKLDAPETVVPAGTEGSVRLSGDPKGRRMGVIALKRGHQAMLPVGAAYRFRSDAVGVLLLQTILGRESVQKWSDICYQ